MIQQAFMNFCDARGCVFSFNLVNNHFVVIWKTIQKLLHLILMIIRLSKDRQLIQFGHHTLHVFINGFVSFGVDLQLVSKLFDMTRLGFAYIAANFSQIWDEVVVRETVG